MYVLSGAPIDYRTRLWIAVLSSRGVLGYATAAHLWQLDETQPAEIDVIVGTSRRITCDGVRVHHVFVPNDVITRIGGLPVTTRTWTLVDHVSLLPASHGLRLLDRGLQRGWVARQDLQRRIAAYPGRRGNTAIRALLDQTGDRAAAESERRLHRLLRSAGITGWVANYDLRINGRLVAVIDIAIPELKLAIEIDGMAYHVDPDRFQNDRHRGNMLDGLGWRVMHFTWDDIVHRPGYVVAQIRQRLPKS